MASVNNATSYQWTIPTGAVISGSTDGNSITVNFGTSSGNITVKGVSSCGIGAVSNPVSVTVAGTSPTTSGIITGETTICASEQNLTYSVASISNADTYLWSLPAGTTIISGENTNSITVNFGATAGNITVKGQNDCGTGTVSDALNISFTAEPSITTQPENVTVCKGVETTLSVATNSVNNITYQWKKDNIEINGATSADYLISSVKADDVGKYKCIVSGCSTIESNEISMNIDSVIITEQPENSYNTDENTGIKISLNATGNIASYSWKKTLTGTVVGTSESLVLEDVVLQDGGEYICTITDLCGETKQSNKTVVTISNIKFISEQETIAEIGTNVVLEVPDAGAGFTYQWRKTEMNISDVQKDGAYTGTNTNRLTISSVTDIDAGNYDCIITGPDFTALSEVFSLEIATGIEDMISEDINIYPNPTNGNFIIEIPSEFFNGKEDNYLMKITDMSGKTIYQENICTSIKSINLKSTFNSGVYFIEITGDKTILKTKLIIE